MKTKGRYIKKYGGETGSSSDKSWGVSKGGKRLFRRPVTASETTSSNSMDIPL